MNNNTFKKISSLKYLKYRKKYEEFMLEGKRLVKASLKSKINLTSVYCTDYFKNENKNWIKSFSSHKGFPLKMTQKQCEKLSCTKTPSGIIATYKVKSIKYLDLKITQWIYLDKISEPGNMGKIIRTADWFGFKNIALSSNCVDPFNPKVVRSGMGAHFNITIHNNISLNKFKNSHKIIAADQSGENVSNYKFPKKFVLLLGNEARGVSKKNLKEIHDKIAIQKKGSGDSLNVSSAGSILMYIISNLNSKQK